MRIILYNNFLREHLYRDFNHSTEISLTDIKITGTTPDGKVLEITIPESHMLHINETIYDYGMQYDPRSMEIKFDCVKKTTFSLGAYKYEIEEFPQIRFEDIYKEELKDE